MRQGVVPGQPVVRGRPEPDAHARGVQRHPELLVAPAQLGRRRLPLVGHGRGEEEAGDRDQPHVAADREQRHAGGGGVERATALDRAPDGDDRYRECRQAMPRGCRSGAPPR
jgi:hypothetical protein